MTERHAAVRLGLRSFDLRPPAVPCRRGGDPLCEYQGQLLNALVELSIRFAAPGRSSRRKRVELPVVAVGDLHLLRFVWKRLAVDEPDRIDQAARLADAEAETPLTRQHGLPFRDAPCRAEVRRCPYRDHA